MEVGGPAAYQRRKILALRVKDLQVAAKTEVVAVGTQQHRAQLRRTPQVQEHLLEVARQIAVDRVAAIRLRQIHDGQTGLHFNADGGGGSHVVGSPWVDGLNNFGSVAR